MRGPLVVEADTYGCRPIHIQYMWLQAARAAGYRPGLSPLQASPPSAPPAVPRPRLRRPSPTGGPRLLTLSLTLILTLTLFLFLALTLPLTPNPDPDPTPNPQTLTP